MTMPIDFEDVRSSLTNDGLIVFRMPCQRAMVPISHRGPLPRA